MATPTRSLRPPFPVLIVATLTVAFLAVPLVGLLTKASWSTLWSDLTTPVAVDALKLSLVCSLWATGLSLVFGVPLAWVLARTEFPGRNLVRALTILPMVLPPVVGGVALLLAFGRDGILGRPLYDGFGLQFTFSTAGAVLAETFVAMPFLIITVEAALRSMDGRYEEAASNLGAGRWTTFRRVSLPMIAPSLVAGTALTWARALGEFGATITFAGDIQSRTQTLPLAVYLALQDNEHVAVALSLALLAISIVVLVCLRGRWLGAIIQ
ncbi:MAG TPA: ABC transporter permease [Acidimicrobiales bacterium]|nr:ABC transporter permease [Acidimicrobiales bacterium]